MIQLPKPYTLFLGENYPALKDAEKVNIKTVTYRQFAWLLQQDGNAIYMVGGPYDEATQNEIADVNAKAVKKDVNVYLWDPYVDGKISEDDWGYKNTGDIMKSDSINFMYTTLIENSLTNLTTEEFENGADGASLTYKNDAGEEKTVPVIKSPFVFSFNKDATDEDGISGPGHERCPCCRQQVPALLEVRHSCWRRRPVPALCESSWLISNKGLCRMMLSAVPVLKPVKQELCGIAIV